MADKKAIVTGGAGFIGSHICDALIERGIGVVIIDDLSSGKKQNLAPDVTFYETDIRDESIPGIFAKEEPDYLFHLAAQMDVRKSVADPMYDASVNVGGMANLLEAGRTVGLEKVIYAATGGAMYGEPKILPADENAPVEPLCPYGLSKGTGEKYLELYRRLYGLNYTSLRFPNVYGPRQDPHGEAGVVAIFSQTMLSGKRPKMFGDGTMTRDYVYVGDIVAANIIALDKGDGEAMNLGWGEEVTVQQVFDGVRDAVGCDIEPEYVPERLGEVAHISLDASKAKKVIGWEPQVELLDGLARAVDFYRRLNAGEITR